MSASVQEPAGDLPASAEWQWYIVGRWQEYEGEAKANLLRIVAIGAFYVVELLNYYGLRLGWLELPRVEGVDQRFHLAVTAVAAAWVLTSLGVLFCLRRQIFPAALKYFATGVDLVCLTTILMLADGPRSPLVVGYFLVVALAGLRFSLPLVWCATGGSLFAYLVLLGYARWFAAPERELRVQRYQQLIMLLAIGLSGVVLGQVVRRVRQIAEDYAARTSTLPASAEREAL